jgi:GPH family glycoside/pentoside/hexuronide:cation symporter
LEDELMASDTVSAPAEAATTAKKAYTAKSLTLHLYSFGAMSDYLLYVPFGFFVVPIFSLEFKLSMIWIGWAMALPRLIDGFLDPVWAHWSDTCKSRWGRRRPFIFWSSFLGAFVIAGMWWASPHWPAWMLFVWLLIANLLVFSFYGIYDNTHLALGYELSDDFNQRARILAIRSFYFSLPGMLVPLYALAMWLGHAQSNSLSYVHWMTQHNSKGWFDIPIAVFSGLARFFGRHPSWFANGIDGIRWVGGGMALLAIIAGLVTIFSCRERFKWAAQREHVNLWRAFTTTIRVRAFVVMLLLQFAQTIGGMLWQQISFFIIVFSLCAGMQDPKTAYGFLGYPGGWVGFGFGFALMFLAAPICKLIGKRYGIILNYGVGALNALLLPFFMRPGYYWIYMAYGLVLIPVFSIGGTFLSAVMPDVCDIDELQSGERREAMFNAVYNWMSKLQNAIITVIAGYFLVGIGFNANLAVQPPGVMERMRFWGFGMMIFGSLLAFAISWWMPITAKQMAEVRAKLDERHRLAGVESSEAGSARESNE